MDSENQRLDLQSPLSVRTAFYFPLQSSLARREILIGALWLLVPFIGWLLNMGHRIMMTHRMQHGLPAWPAWNNYPQLLKHGCITFLGMLEYHAPAIACELVAWKFSIPPLHILALLLWILASITVPGYMSHYCYSLQPAEVFNPARALLRVLQGGAAYWHGMGYCPNGTRPLLYRFASFGRRLLSHQRLVLASGRLLLRHSLQPEIRSSKT